MNDTVRGLVLLSSVLLWLPFLRPTLDGSLTIEQAVLRYAATLLLAWAGGAFLTALVRGYAAPADDSPAAESTGTGSPSGATDVPQRRAEDHAPGTAS